MLKKRIIGSIVINNNWAVQSIKFNKYTPIGKPQYSVEFLDKWGVDEIIISDISATLNQSKPNYKLLNQITEKCSVPITYGGGIKSISDMIKILKYGADKICINNIVLKNPKIVFEGAKILGRQCILVSIDVICHNGKFEVYDYVSKKSTGIDLIEFVKKIVNFGAGEVVVRNINHDGMKIGYDIDMISKIATLLPIPVIAAGGYGIPQHALDCFNNTNISACAIGNALAHIEHSVALIKSYLSNQKCPIRHETTFTYLNGSINGNGRHIKYNDDYLENLIYEKIPEIKI